MLSNIKRNNVIRSGKRVGRGYGSGKGGHTAGRGQKGQNSRTGHKSTVMFEGGNVPMFRRMPKYRGQKNQVLGKTEYVAVNVAQLEAVFEAGAIVNLEALKAKKLVKQSVQLVKILGSGELKKNLVIEKMTVSESAKAKVLAAKGSIVA